jgi:hypothetical protein
MIKTLYNILFAPVKVFGLAAPVKSGSNVDVEVGVVTADVIFETVDVIFETADVAVGPTKVAGKLTLKDRAHA